MPPRKRARSSAGSSTSAEVSCTVDGTDTTARAERAGELYEAGQLCDGKLVLNVRTFPVSRILLAAASPFFRSAFTGGMREGEGTVQLDPSLQPEGVEALLNGVCAWRSVSMGPGNNDFDKNSWQNILFHFLAGLGTALTAADPAGLTPPTGVAAGLAGCLAGPLEGLAAALTGTAGALPPTGAAGALPPTGAAAGLALTGAAGAFAGCVAAPATGVNAGESCETSAEGAFAAAGASGSLGRPGGALAAREAAGAPRCCCCRGGARRWRDEQRKE